jgi:hypothetical protein
MANITQDEITVDFVNTKTKFPKFSSGSLKLTNGEWLTVSKDVDIEFFKKGSSYQVEIETNEKGYQSLVKVLGGGRPEVNDPAPTEDKITTKPVRVTKEYKERDFDAEARGKSRFGLFAAALQSPALAGMKFDTLEEFLELVKKAADAGLVYTFEGK